MNQAQTVNGPNGSPQTREEAVTAVNAVILANAGELASGIVSEIAGNDMASSINGSKATVEIVQNLLHQRIAKRLNERARKR